MERIPKAVDLLAEAKKLKIFWKPDLEYNALDYRYAMCEAGARISTDRLTFTGAKQWNTALTRGCTDSGKWYFECTINNPNENWRSFKVYGWDSGCKTVEDVIQRFPHLKDNLQPSLRIGFGTRLARFDSPIGDNPFGCAICQSSGELVNGGITRFGGLEDNALKAGDIIGCAISLGTPQITLPDPRGNVNLWPFLRRGLLCDVTNKDIIEKIKVPNHGSFVKFSINGKWLENKIEDVYCVEYHPGISTFMGASATLNLGPYFTYSPPDELYRCACDMENSRYPCKDDLLRFWVLGDSSILAKDATIIRGYTARKS